MSGEPLNQNCLPTVIFMQTGFVVAHAETVFEGNVGLLRNKYCYFLDVLPSRICCMDM